MVSDAHTTGAIQLPNGDAIEAADVVEELNIVMTWISYPGRKSSAIAVEDINFAAPGGSD